MHYWQADPPLMSSGLTHGRNEGYGNPYLDNHVVPGEPAGEPHQPEAIDDAMGWEHLDSEAVAGEPAEEPHQPGTSSEAMDWEQRQQPVQPQPPQERQRRDRRGRHGPGESDSKRLGKALLAILRHDHANQWLTIDELLVRLRRPPSRDNVVAVLAEDTQRFVCRPRGPADAGGWVEYEYRARPKAQR